MEKTEIRCNVLLVASEGRLYADSEGGFWMESDEGGEARAGSPEFVTAAEELLADGDLVKLEAEAGSAPVELTDAGAALFTSWGAGR
jgi:mono/diheme cytochrome c family protein